MSALHYMIPDLSLIEDAVEVTFDIAPCKFQLQCVQAQLDQKDIITIAPTGAGKTLTFWIPLLFNNDSIVIFITALNGLGDQNIKELQQLVIIVSPELVINDRCFDDLWRVRDFTAHLFNITIDEGHCISQWGKDFRPEYSQLGKLCWLLLLHVPFHVVSATLPAHILKDISASLNIHPPKFMIFCNSRQDSQRMAEYLHGQLRPELHHKIVWFHSRMTQEFRMDMTEKLCGGELWGMCCTDTAGMGLDIRDINLCTLMQRLGRAACDPSMEASSFYFVEKDYKKRKGNGTKVNDGSKKGKPREQPSHRSDHESSDSGSESDGNEINDTLAPCRNNGVSMSASPGKLLPLSAGMGIDEFELVVMGVYIEAGNQTICRRRIADEYFRNNLIDGDNDLDGCCKRCKKRTMKLRLCCDVCTLHGFLLFYTSPPVKPKRKRKTKLPAYEMDARDYTLQSDLKGWHQKMLVDLGINDPFFGPALILPDLILTHIIDLSHHSKLSDVSSLRDLMDWCYADEYGGNVLNLVCKHYPPPAVVQAPQPNMFVNTSNTASLPAASNPLVPSAVPNNGSKKPRKATVCSKCKQVGHNSMLAVLF
ncbi:hypothetical protein CY34DRAFT_27154 [Suillus luteus UH-Slu-Lm8-n1]|uniref:DNA 3'-5' helicase n=1 Tax=Suillus luteus UH-Slu-Lm8-n1 TaxID=930992 RepID=A0A0C9Z5P4_9AGAM|nr:hypothetical protein CY34DRAFT_27154 [Suillus luteus UH-Slu-Lm8-n1]